MLIYEDDIDFCPNFLYKLSACLSELPDNWHGLHLAGYHPNGSQREFSENLNRCFRTWGGYAYILNQPIYEKLLEITSNERSPFDTYMGDLMVDYNWYKAKEMLVYHLPGYSYIQEKELDHKNLYK